MLKIEKKKNLPEMTDIAHSSLTMSSSFLWFEGKGKIETLKMFYCASMILMVWVDYQYPKTQYKAFAKQHNHNCAHILIYLLPLDEGSFYVVMRNKQNETAFFVIFVSKVLLFILYSTSVIVHFIACDKLCYFAGK